MLRTILSIIFFSLISFGIVYGLYMDQIASVQKPVTKITPENYSPSIKQQIEYGDIVEITGTPDLLHQVSQEGEIESEDGSKTEGIQYYYVGLKEYGYDFVVRINPGKLFSETQTFKGKVTGLTQTDFGNRIKNSLNKPINFQDSVNKEAAKELDVEFQEEIAQQSEANFTSSTLLILDNEIVNKNDIYAKVFFWGVLLDIFLIAVFRKVVFNL
ncbi:MAG: hypothetical protein KatS3mg085_011 [Candidatus Dojkabacteria bacterium]|nr:MAG: hypothetical protein KatS3mg085_011 [Candidatus Dojkabacteria bacterium]